MNTPTTLPDGARLAPEAFAEAARSWAAFGNPRQAAAVRAEARRVLAAPSATAEGAAVHH